MGYFGYGVLELSVDVWFLMELALNVIRARRTGATDADSGSRNVISWALLAAFFLGGAAFRFLTWAALPDWTYPVGVALIWAGVSLRFWSVYLLGRFFTTFVMTHDDQTVIESGPYKYIRHPSYLGAMAALIGLGLGSGNYLTLLCLATIPLAGLVVRITVEEKALVGALGQAYADYMTRTARLLPGIW